MNDALRQHWLLIGGVMLLFVLLILPPHVHRTLIAFLPPILGFVLTSVAIEWELLTDEDEALRKGGIGALLLVAVYLVLNACLAYVNWHPFDFGGVIGSVFGMLLLVGIPAIIGVVGAITCTPRIQSLIWGGYGAVALFILVLVTGWINLPVYPVFGLLIPMFSAGWTVRDLVQTQSDAPRNAMLQEGMIAGVMSGVVNALFAVIIVRFLLCLGVASCTNHFTPYELLISDVLFALLIGFHMVSAWIGAGIALLIFDKREPPDG